MSKFILTGKRKGLYNEENPISEENLFELANFYPNGISFVDGNLNLNMYGLEDLSVSLDNRYSFVDHTHDISDIVSGVLEYENLPFSELDVTNWNTAFNWGNHSTQGYITGISVESLNTNPGTNNVALIEGVTIKETLTKLNQPVIENNVLTLSYTDETNTTKTVSVNLSAVISENSGIKSVSYSSSNNVVTLMEEDGDIWNINLSSLKMNTTQNPSGSLTVKQGSVTYFTISKVGQSGQWNDILNKPNTISGYGITDAYNMLSIDRFFNGASPMPGYNKDNWDTAYSWGDHSTQGYLKEIPDGSIATYGNWNLGIEGTYSQIGSQGNVNFVGSGGTTITKSGDDIIISSQTTSAGEADGNNYPTSFSFGESILRLNRDGLSPITQDLSDGTIDVDGNIVLSNSYNGLTLLCSNTLTITIPSNLNTKFSCNIINIGENNEVVTILQGSGTVLKAPHGTKLLSDYTCNIMKRTGSNTFHLQGELTF